MSDRSPSRWVQGGEYDYFGRTIRCVRRWFDGSLEMVHLAFAGEDLDRALPLPGRGVAHLSPAEGGARTARAIGPCIEPPITETLGGVRRPDACDHRYPLVAADGGLFAGRRCCSACGVPPDEDTSSAAFRAAVEAADRRAMEAPSR